MENQKPKSFKLSSNSENPFKFRSMKTWTLKDYNRNAITYFLLGWIASNYGGILIIQVAGDVLMVAGIVLEIVYWYKRIKEKRANKKDPIKEVSSIPSENSINKAPKQNNIKKYLNQVKNHKFIILTVIILLGLFYWFQLRPNIIKRQCSWFTYTTQTPAVPAFDGVTREQAERAQLPYKRFCADQSTGFCDINTFISAPRPAIPASPIEEITRSASKAEYDTCLRHHGL